MLVKVNSLKSTTILHAHSILLTLTGPLVRDIQYFPFVAMEEFAMAVDCLYSIIVFF